MELFQAQFRKGWQTFARFCRWVALGTLVGIVVAFAEAAFHYANELANHTRQEHGWLLFLLPLSGLVIAGLYQLCGIQKDRGTNLALIAARENQNIALRVAPLIGVSTVLTHLTGGSAGREGAALQIGGSIASFLSRRLPMEERESRIMEMCGMAAGFAALFGTPLAAVVFAVEVESVGVMQYAALAPCTVAALTAHQAAEQLHCETTFFALAEVPEVSWMTLGAVLVFGCLCGVLAWFEALVLEKVHHWFDRLIPNHYLCSAAGGCIVVAIMLLLGTRDYCGPGMEGITRAIGGEAAHLAFFWKLLLTALTLGAGFKGGEIVPTFFIGATFGCTVGGLLGLPSGFAAALGVAALFCGVTNAPLASMMLAYELFGGAGLPLFVLVCAVSFRLSGYGGLYSAQKIAYSKELPIPLDAEGAVQDASPEERVSGPEPVP